MVLVHLSIEGCRARSLHSNFDFGGTVHRTLAFSCLGNGGGGVYRALPGTLGVEAFPKVGVYLGTGAPGTKS